MLMYDAPTEPLFLPAGGLVSESSSAAPRRKPGKRTWIIILVLLVVGYFGLEWGSRVLFAPWSIGVFGETLTGDWVGTVQARQGAEYGLSLQLDYRSRPLNSSSSRGSGPSNNLQGEATLCTPTGERYDFSVSGYANRSGEIKTLWLEYGDPSLSALDLTLTGKFDAPTLAMATTFPDNPFLPDGSFVFPRAVSSADPDDSFAPFTLTKGDAAALEEICAEIVR